LHLVPSPKKNRLTEDQLVAALPPKVRALAAQGVIRRYKAYTVLIEEGDQGDAVFIVLHGTLRIYCAAPNGREITLALYGPGEYVGEMSLDGGPRSASVATASDCVCAMVTGLTLRKHVANNAEFALELIERLIRRARLATESARSLALLDAYGRLAKLLNQLAKPQTGGTRIITQVMTHEEISQRLGCSRVLVSRILKDLVRGGYLKLQTRQYVMLQALPERW
jgi:CRP/FNR family transcriptional regulator, cyclic AMP receptor protein